MRISRVFSRPGCLAWASAAPLKPLGGLLSCWALCTDLLLSRILWGYFLSSSAGRINFKIVKFGATFPLPRTSRPHTWCSALRLASTTSTEAVSLIFPATHANHTINSNN